ncbi:SDR family NAD(P)-dependent oxidoreductase [Actinomadura citrea]|uniref:NADP-dependent 3-hydroxy acid dehydrogenase YdfG n=1 Tax=Actinomadura citrea TaxID=46158 RepID=A0A7Y9GGI8_9ACTN|nr:SDR family NAD(P)-dependent oxidoreductase [Actinomadura citrea]NYE16004.1 NADP-dependent 3-hydroxy acid dehydrogenase YdfG [Actinomadura citrea]GGT68536.1 short-chain dehydrogenase [Actinomadura citrea]
MSSTTVVIGAGPGLGMSVAHRFGREGHKIVLLSRNPARHPGYLAALEAEGIEATARAADVRDRDALLAALDAVGPVDVVYYGPGAADPDARPTAIASTDVPTAKEAMSWVYPAIDVVGAVLPGMLERGGGGLLFAGGLSAVVPMPMLGGFALSSAALRNYALTLNAALTEKGIYAGTLTIGGLIERGDIHRMIMSRMEDLDGITVGTLDPDDIADTAWDLYAKRDRAEAVFNALA